ncbi:MAG TPA: ABC transporter ATP-binding protein [Parapedobacter sp.]|uniref:ABC transporter ATP-binding protein n=1 Tax=Parapedobacter sp. TaxID=1958893 RepID=UPI002BA75464|nr:ABC transporter ATP-binding protein [Parapedobacter sp.]HWK56108.1 ABC transporter ATP-binding protein [Parapedobacter sp.]
MIKSISIRFQQILSNLDVRKPIALVWSLAGGMTLLVILMIVVETALFFGSLYALKGLLDIVAQQDFGNPDFADQIIRQVAFAGILAGLYNVAKAISAYTTEIQAAKVSEHINNKIHEKAVSLELAYYESPAYFDILQRAREAGSERPNAVIIALLDTVKNLLSMLAIASIIISIDWLLLPILVLFVLPTLFVRIHYSGKLNELRIKNTPLERKTTYLSNLITTEVSAKEVRAYNLGHHFKKQYFGIRLQLMAERLKISLQRTKGEVLTTSLASLGFFACIFYIAMGAINGTVSAGDITIFLVIFPQIFNLMQGVTAAISVVYQNNIFVNSIFELFEMESDFDKTHNPAPIPGGPDMCIEMKHVSFTYPHLHTPTLEDISIDIPVGKIVGLVGLNGAGKSTLIKLITRLYDPTEGRIELGGMDIRRFSLSDYRKQIGVVFQDFTRFNMSVAENISLGDISRGEHSKDDISNAAKLSGAHEFIRQFDKGYDTMMGRIFEDGQEVSIGQWQKLATARALYSSGHFLILDEATSALDTTAEYTLFDKLRSHVGNRGTLVISHRYSTVKNADYVYVLDRGRIVEEGSPLLLARSNGTYATLFNNEILDEESLR